MRKAYFFVIVAVILTIVFSVVKRKINEPENICTILGIVFFVLIVFNLISSIPQILTNNNKTAVSQEENDIAEKRFTGDKPNVYFFLFDELTSMVKEVNSTQLSKEEILSDHVYFYSRETGQISM